MASAKVSDKGQITLPASVRRRLGIAANSRVEIILRGDEIVIRPVKGLGELYGILQGHLQGGRPVPWDEQRRQMEAAVAREVADE
jgi:AbrB family looped-hinge helix DNA binding protein